MRSGMLEAVLEHFALHQAYPNPFNPTTSLAFALPEATQVKLTVYDVAGRSVTTLIDGWRDAGHHQVTYDATNLASGIYIYRMQTGEFTASGKMVLIK